MTAITTRSQGASQAELPLFATATCTVRQVPQPGGGMLLVPGKVLVKQREEWISCEEASKVLGMPLRTVQWYVQHGYFKGAWQMVRGGTWRLPKKEVLAARGRAQEELRECSLFD